MGKRRGFTCEPRPERPGIHADAKRRRPSRTLMGGGARAHDLLGHDCANDNEAKDHGSFIAHRTGSGPRRRVRCGMRILCPCGMSGTKNCFRFRSPRRQRDGKIFLAIIAIGLAILIGLSVWLIHL
jgi:hypothetical protein